VVGGNDDKLDKNVVNVLRATRTIESTYAFRVIQVGQIEFIMKDGM